jgi:hypothetical protein
VLLAITGLTKRTRTGKRGEHTGNAARSRWARLLARIYEVFPLVDPGRRDQVREGFEKLERREGARWVRPSGVGRAGW